MKTFPVSQNPGAKITLPVITIGITVALTAIGLRLWARRLKNARLNLADYTVLFAMAIALSEYGLWIQGITIGEGMHTRDMIRLAPENLMFITKTNWVDSGLWATAVSFIKISILLIYLKVFNCHRKFTWLVYLVIVLCAAFCVASWVGLLLMCRPIAAFWDWTIKGGHCPLDPVRADYISGTINLILDIIIVVLPMPIVWQLRLPTRKKVGVSAMFGLGTVIVVLVGIRFHLLVNSGPDFNYQGDIAGIFSALEVHLGIVSACLPVLSPAIREIYNSVSQNETFQRLLALVGLVHPACVWTVLASLWPSLAHAFG